MVGLRAHEFGTAGGRQLQDLQREAMTMVNPFRLDPSSNCSE
jgi:hypothetical protein